MNSFILQNHEDCIDDVGECVGIFGPERSYYYFYYFKQNIQGCILKLFQLKRNISVVKLGVQNKYR